MEGAIHIEVIQEVLLITLAMKKNQMEDDTTKLTNTTAIIIEKEGTMKEGGLTQRNTPKLGRGAVRPSTCNSSQVIRETSICQV